MINKPCRYIITKPHYEEKRGTLLSINTDYHEASQLPFLVGVIQTESGNLITVDISSIEIIK